MSRVISQGYNTVLHTTTLTWAASSTVGTPKNIDVTLPSVIPGDNICLVVTANASTYSDLTAKAQVTWVDESTTTRYGLLTSWAVSNSSGNGKLVQGMLMSTGARLTFSNDTAATSSAAITAYVKIYAL